ncbi:uncharacterized protein N7498_008919 [Penicillium cinerascens]|uniref:Uncharacterized protein n=1 Tax=Penicillium cinerascens TaxID=70096 RepID=A0A9W9JJK9_9EURO|nr:uncharacterized protein N7498_008919 [Penicillium cinerascens]KAJ5195481.1 hypothetical protein N7498_008919 [Penicillium cinerascens]
MYLSVLPKAAYLICFKWSHPVTTISDKKDQNTGRLQLTHNLGVATLFYICEQPSGSYAFVEQYCNGRRGLVLLPGHDNYDRDHYYLLTQVSRLDGASRSRAEESISVWIILLVNFPNWRSTKVRSSSGATQSVLTTCTVDINADE